MSDRLKGLGADKAKARPATTNAVAEANGTYGSTDKKDDGTKVTGVPRAAPGGSPGSGVRPGEAAQPTPGGLGRNLPGAPVAPGEKVPRPVHATAQDCLKPEPNTLYESNGYLYRTDAEGRLVEASGQLRLQTAPRNTYQQAQVGHSSGVAGDDGGHMIGAQFGGLGEGPLHMVPQGMKLNRGAGSQWTAMEREWAKALGRGDKVSASVEVEWEPGARRPAGFTVRYAITDRTTGGRRPVERYFPNP